MTDRTNQRRTDQTPDPNELPDGTDDNEAGEGRPTLRAVPMFADTSHWAPSFIPMDESAENTELGSDRSDRNRRGWIDERVEIDWRLVRRLKADSVDRVEAEINKYRLRRGQEPSTDDEREMGKPIIAGVVADYARSEAAGGRLWPAALEERYFKAVFDSQFGYGRLQPLFEIPDAENITIHGCDSVKVHYADGAVEKWPPVADSDEELLEQLRQMGSNARPRRTLDAHNVDMTLMLGHRFRVHAISDEISVRPRVAIRQHLLTRVSLGDLAVRGMMPESVARFLDAAVRANLTIAVSGEQSVGKTTFLRALIDAVPDNEAFGTMETDLELFSHLMPGRDNEMALFARSGMGERGPDGKRVGEIGISSLVDMGVRQFLRRFIVGEVRGSEASALFQAMAIGTGTMFTIHSRDAQTAPIRLASRVAEGRVYSVDEAMRQIGLLVDLIVFIEVIDDRHIGGIRRRCVSQIAHCSPGEHGRPAISPLYSTDVDGNPATFNPPPDMLARLRRYSRDSLPRHEG